MTFPNVERKKTNKAESFTVRLLPVIDSPQKAFRGLMGNFLDQVLERTPDMGYSAVSHAQLLSLGYG